MNRNFGISVLIFCFGLSSVNAALASQVIAIPPVIVQPEDIGAINEQALEEDRINRDQELAIRGLIDENQQLAATAVANQQDATIDKISQVMGQYRDYLLSRDHARIEANSQHVSRYDDLIKLTVDVDNMKGFRQTLQAKSDTIETKYKVLTELKNEMVDVNEKLKAQETNRHLQMISSAEETKIQMLTQRLAEMDQKIAQYDGILAQKDQQIMQLKHNLANVQAESAGKDGTIKQQEAQITGLYNSLAHNRTQTDRLSQQVSQKNEQLELLKSELTNQVAALAQQSQALSNKEEAVRSQAAQMASTMERYNDQSAAYANAEAQLAALRSQIDQQGSDLKAKNDKIHWLNQALAVVKDKAEYYKLGSQESQYSLKDVQGQVSNIKDDFTQRFKDYDHFEKAIYSLKNQVSRLESQVSLKQQKIDLLQSEFNYKIIAANDQIEKDKQIERGLKKQLRNKTADQDQLIRLAQQVSDKQGQVDALKVQLQSKTANHEQVNQLEKQVDFLKAQVVDLVAEENKQGQQGAQAQQDLKAQVQAKEDQIVKMRADIKAILDDRANKEIYLHNASLQMDNRVDLAKQLIDLQAQEASLLEEKSRLEAIQNENFEKRFSKFENKIQGSLASRQAQTEDLQSRIVELQGELDQKEQRIELLKKTLVDKIAAQKNQIVLAEQIQDLKTQLQDKDNQIASMKSTIQSGQATQADVDALKQQLADEQNKEEQLKQDLDGKNAQFDQTNSMLQDYQKKLEDKDNAYNQELSQVIAYKNEQAQRQVIVADLSAQLQEKDAQVIKIKKDIYDLRQLANAKDMDAQSKDLNLSMIQQRVINEKINEYQGKVNELQSINEKQARVIAGLGGQLALARQKLSQVPGEDEIEFLRAGLNKATLQLEQKDAMLAQAKIKSALPKREVLEDQLMSAKAEIKSLHKQLDQFILSSQNDPAAAKLQQALDKIDQQGRVINALVQKLQELGQSVDLTRIDK